MALETCPHLVLLFVGLCLGQGNSCFEDTQNQGAYGAGMCRDVAIAAEVAGLKAGQLLLGQLAEPADTSNHLRLE